MFFLSTYFYLVYCKSRSSWKNCSTINSNVIETVLFEFLLYNWLDREGELSRALMIKQKRKAFVGDCVTRVNKRY